MRTATRSKGSQLRGNRTLTLEDVWHNQSWDHIWQEVLKEVWERGNQCHPTRPSREIIAYQFRLPDPRDRLLANPIAPFNFFQAIAQFLWILQGHFDLSSMAFYTARARYFSDDGRTMRGAYGIRISGVGPLNQLRWTIVKKLPCGLESRRSYVAVYDPQLDVHDIDAVEVPCLKGFNLLRRGDTLIMKADMRSQNVFGLLPLDIFILTMIYEWVSAQLCRSDESLGCFLGDYIHNCDSFHVYEADEEFVREAIASRHSPFTPMASMPPIDETDDPIAKLGAHEQLIRRIVGSGWSVPNKINALRFEVDAVRKLSHRYWMDLGLALAVHGFGKLEAFDEAEELAEELPAAFRFYYFRWAQQRATKV